MKRIESVKLSGLNGERVDVVTFARWKKKIAGIEFSFALHLLPSFKVGLPNKLWISELGTGFNTLVVVKHPVSGQHMTDVMADKLGQSYVVRLAKSALHNRLKRCGDSAFVDGLVRAEMLLAKQQRQREQELEHASQVPYRCEVCEDSGVQAEQGADGGLLAVACKSCGGEPYVPSPEEAAAALADAEKMNHNMRTFGTIDAPSCDVCLGSKVVCTTDTDHEGQPVEASCPECVEKNGGLKGGTFQISGTLSETYRNQELLDKLREITEADLPRLRQRRDEVQSRMDQHGTMTGDTSDQGYESLSDEIDELNQHIANLEDSPCSK